jgi:hypothetical protein
MYLALFNNTYKRQFEIAIKKEAFDKIMKRHNNNFPEAAEAIFTHFYRKKRTTTSKKHRAFMDFISYNIRVLGLESYIIIANSKSDYLKYRMRRRPIGRGGVLVIKSSGRGEFRARRR